MTTTGKSKTQNQKTLAVAAFHWSPPFIIDNQWCWPFRAPCFAELSLFYMLTGASPDIIEAGETSFYGSFISFHPKCSRYRVWLHPIFILRIIATSRSTCLPPSQSLWRWAVKVAERSSVCVEFTFSMCVWVKWLKPFRGLTVLHLLFFVSFPFCFSALIRKRFIVTWLWTTDRFSF